MSVLSATRKVIREARKVCARYGLPEITDLKKALAELDRAKKERKALDRVLADKTSR